jgi:hypothetical protein
VKYVSFEVFWGCGVVGRGPLRGGKIKFSKTSKTTFSTAPHSRSDERERLKIEKYDWVDENFN